LVSTISAYPDRVEKVVFTPDGTMLASIGSERAGGQFSVKFWDAATGRLRKRIADDDLSRTDSLFFSDDGRTLIVAAQDGTVRFASVPRPATTRNAR
jgi:WD40 repeat protein